MKYLHPNNHRPPNEPHKDIKQAPMSMLLGAAEHEHQHYVRKKLEAVGVSRAIGPVLTTVARRDGITQAELAQTMGFKASSISVTIQQMLSLGYISKTPDETDARQFHLSLTDEGRALDEKIKKTFADAEEHLCRGISAEEQVTLRAILIKIIESERSEPQD